MGIYNLIHFLALVVIRVILSSLLKKWLERMEDLVELKAEVVVILEMLCQEMW